jgi:hypothetical protein
VPPPDQPTGTPCGEAWCAVLPKRRARVQPRQLGHRRLQVAGQHVDVADEIGAPEHAEVELAVVAHDRDPQPVLAHERHEREDVVQAPAEQVQRHGRARDVRHGEVEQARAGHLPGDDPHHLRRARGRRRRRPPPPRPTGRTPSSRPCRA